MESGSSRVVRFGVFEVDLGARELRKRGVRVRLQDQPSRVLQALLEKPGETVTRDALKDRLWADDEFVEFDKSLNTAIQKIRQALGDSAESPRFLETVPRQGYRFIAPVDESQQVPPAEPTEVGPTISRERLFWVGAVFALVLAGVAVGTLIGPTSADPENRPVRKFTITPELPPGIPGVRRPRPSPDGRYVAFGHSPMTPHTRRVVIWDAVQDEFDALEVETGAVFWSPDSGSVGLVGNSRVRSVDLLTGFERVVTSWPDKPGWFTAGATWSPDGKTIVFAAGPSWVGQRLHRTDAAGGGYEALFTPSQEEVDRGLGFFYPSFLPDFRGRQSLLYAEGVLFAADIGVVNLETGERRTIVSGDATFGFPMYSASGHVVYNEAGGRIWALPFSVESLKPTGAPFVIAESAGDHGISGHGMLVYGKPTPGSTMQLGWRDRSGNQLGLIGEAHEVIQLPVLSPDGQEVVVLGRENGVQDIWVHEVERPVKRRITFDATHNDRPTWHPSGNRLTFSAGTVGRSDIWISASDGSGEPALFYESPASDFGFEWSADGKYLVGSGSHFLFYLKEKDAGDGWEKVVLEDDQFDHVGPELSPDGLYLAYQSDKSGRDEVYVRPFPEGGREWLISVNGGAQPRWQGKGDEIFYVEGDTLMAVPVTLHPVFTHGSPERLFEGDGVFYGRGQRYDVSGDGLRFVVVEGADQRDAKQVQVVQNWYEEFRDSE